MKLEKDFYIEFMKRDTYSIRHEITGYIDLTDEEIKKIHDKNVNVKLTLEVEEPILDEEERKYLSSVIRPFKKQVRYIEKVREISSKEFIKMHINGSHYFLTLPPFKTNIMYKGMELNKEYTLKDLGL